MLNTDSTNGYSAKVTLALLIFGQRIPLAQIGGGRLIFPDPVRIAASSGEVIMTVDGHERRWAVTFLQPAEPTRILHAEFHETVEL